MKRYKLIILLSFFSLIAQAQQLYTNTNQLNFGVAYENSPDSLPITIRNAIGRAVTVTGIRFYVTYGQNAFTASSDYFTIQNNDSVTIWIRFSPRHNIFHNSELVIENDGLRGYPAVDLLGQGRYSNTYYNTTENLKEQGLKTQITTLLGTNYLSLGYNIARDSMFMSIDNKRVNGQGATQNTLECVYTGREAIGYINRTDCQNLATYAFNTEHTFPQSFFASQEPMKSDLFHLFPTDNTANNERADNPFGIVTNPSWSVGGSKSNGTTFEPRDVHKGETARALFYFVLRYQDYTNFVSPQEPILRAWYTNWLPTVIEQQRNNKIYTLQHDRNPFIDYPQFLERITSICNTSIEATLNLLDRPLDTIIYGTVTPGITALYRYTIVNNGNTSASLSGISLSNTSIFSFQGSSSDTVIGPGEAFSIDIACNVLNTDSVRAFLYFTTNLPGTSLVTTPIFVNDLQFTAITSVNTRFFSIYPNPSTGMIWVSTTSESGFKYELSDISGQVLLYGKSSQAQALLNFEALSAGVYHLRILSNNSAETKMLIIQ